MLKRLRASLARTRKKLASGLSKLFGLNRDLDEAFLAELEEVLYSSDLGPAGLALLKTLRQEFKERKLKTTGEVHTRLRELLAEKLGDKIEPLKRADSGPTVILFVGVNGSGKTTSIAKLANLLKKQGHSVLVGACDTFRAAAVEQLSIWADRLGVDVIKQAEGADPAAVAFDTVAAALARDVDYALIDTAGRLHTRDDLMAQLEKLHKVVKKKIPDAPHETFLVLDATTGQNAIRQAEHFTQFAPLTGVVLAKLDGTARGGAVIAIQDQLNLKVRYVGLGETADDMEEFNPSQFLDAILKEEE